MAFPTALDTILAVLHSLSSMADQGWEEEEEDTCNSDGEKEVDVLVVVNGLN